MLAPRRTPRPVLLQLFCSVWFGITLLALILAYASIFSALPQVRGALELTEMAAFRHWAFTALIALFTITLTTVTVVRIRWSMVNLGVLTVHAGLILLVLSSAWYFSTKVEGDTLLISPKIQILGPDGKPLPQAALLPEAGQSWGTRMPALGGNVKIEVLDVANTDDPKAITATVRFTSDNTSPQDLTLNSKAPTRLNHSLSARLVPAKPVDCFFDNELSAVAVRPVNNDPQHVARIEDWEQFPIEGLPLFRERYLDQGYELEDSNGKEVPTKRLTPHIPGTLISTAWFEPWRMPIDIPTTDLPFDVRVTGYAPYIAGLRNEIGPGGAAFNPGIQLSLQAGGSGAIEWMLANDPIRSLWALATPIEFVWEADPEKWESHFQSLVGPDQLTIEVTDPPVKLTVPIASGQVIEVPGTSYQLTINELIPDWPMMTPGFENARSPTALIAVQSADQKFTRTVIQRFPQLSQDTDDQGVRHRDALVDDNLKLSYNATSNGWIRIVAGPNHVPEAAVYDSQGNASRLTLEPGKSQMIQLPMIALKTTILSVVEKAALREVPVIEPIETRRPNMGRFASAVRLQFTGHGEHSDWTDSRWVMFSAYHHQDARPVRVQPPGCDTSYDVIFSRFRRPLGATLIPRRLDVSFFPGRNNVESWHSDFYVAHAGEKPQPAAVYTNQTYVVDNWTLFQSGAAQDHWSYTVLGVGNRQGIALMVLACVMITLGCMYAFYVKPILIRRLYLRSMKKAEQRQTQSVPTPAKEVVEVR